MVGEICDSERRRRLQRVIVDSNAWEQAVKTMKEQGAIILHVNGALRVQEIDVSREACIAS